MENINSISPIERDKSLIENIGKYNQISQRLIIPIGGMYDIYGSVPIKKESIVPNGLLDYINNTKIIENNGELSETLSLPSLFDRGVDSINLGYDTVKSQKYSYIDGKGYNDPKDKNWISMGISAAVGYAMGDSVGLSLSGGGVDLVSTSLKESTSLVARVAEVALGDSDLANQGLLSVASAFANSIAQKTRMSEEVNDFFKKPVDFYNAVDTLELDKFKNIKIPLGLLNFSEKYIPIYFYTEIRKDKTSEFHSDNANITTKTDFSWVNKVGYKKDSLDYAAGTYSGANTGLVDEKGNSISMTNITQSTQSLLSKTQKLFQNGKIETMLTEVGRYKSDGDKDINENNRQSRGRNLTAKNNDSNFCRVWTATNQYNKISSLIRPFDDINTTKLNKDLSRVRRDGAGSDALNKYGVLQSDGFVKIAPYKDDKFTKDDIKKYMFSIENLAWKDSIDSLIKDTSQDGPNGGRLMWFPPYDITFNETTSVNWNSDTFIGRGEPVYTYVNTERSGTLNFKVIVDHPSIINYYKQSNDESNNSIAQEDDYLRFFAGCDVLNLPTGTTKIVDSPAPVKKSTPVTPRTITFNVYFPNNYSGIKDGFDDAVTYLREGENCSISGGPGYEMLIGPWSGLTSNSASMGEPCYGNNYYYRVDSEQKLKPEQYEDMASFGLNSTSSNTDDSSYSFSDVYDSIETSDKEVINQDEIRSKQVTHDYNKAIIDFDAANLELIDAKNELKIAVGINNPNNINNGSTESIRVTNAINNYNTKNQIALEAAKLDNSVNGIKSISVNLTVSIDDTGKSNTVSTFPDMKDLNLKKQIYLDAQKNVLNYLNICTVYANQLASLVPGTTGYTDMETNYFEAKSDYQFALDGDLSDTGYFTGSIHFNESNNSYLISKPSTTTYNEIYQTLLDATDITIVGSASKHGIETQNLTLVENRGAIIKNWLMKYNKTAKYNFGSAYSTASVEPDKDTSSEKAKKDRFAKVTITTIPNSINIESEAKKSGLTTITPSVNTGKTNTSNIGPVRIKKSMYGYYNDPTSTDPMTRLRNDEAMFFQRLGDDSLGKIIEGKLSEKIKYFHPAFHSSTPEGFNSRLTFLHQCTRQGPTLSTSDNRTSGRSSTNMAFGRPPICVLRIGDFYHTKVIFESLNIDFDPLVWDLNQEGVGVQPMIATISMNFKFIGGSDLTGPIARLQNAITFNFFANASVYDDRTDRKRTGSMENASHTLLDGTVVDDSYEALYNPFVYDTNPTVDAAKANQSDDSLNLNTVTEEKSADKEPYHWIGINYTYDLVTIGSTRQIIATDVNGINNKKGTPTTASTAVISNQTLFETLRDSIENNL